MANLNKVVEQRDFGANLAREIARRPETVPITAELTPGAAVRVNPVRITRRRSGWRGGSISPSIRSSSGMSTTLKPLALPKASSPAAEPRPVAGQVLELERVLLPEASARVALEAHGDELEVRVAGRAPSARPACRKRGRPSRWGSRRRRGAGRSRGRRSRP